MTEQKKKIVVGTVSTWLSDPPAFIPAVGDVVRVLEVAPFDATPNHKVGDVVVVRKAEPSCHGSNWAYVADDAHPHDGTWCRVEKLPAIEVGSVWACAHNQARYTVIDETPNAYRMSVGGNETGDGPYNAATFAWLFPHMIAAAPVEAPVRRAEATSPAFASAPPAVAKPSAPPTRKSYVPKPGERVRVTALAPREWGPLKVGDELTANYVVEGYEEGHGPAMVGYICINGEKGEVATWCMVEKVEMQPAATNHLVSRYASISRLADAAASLGPNALSLLADIADRLVLGKAHGDFEKQQDWSKEAYEEDLDALVYRTLALKQRVAQ